MQFPAGQNPPVELAPHDLLLTRGSSAPVNQRSQGGQASWQLPLAEGTGQARDPARIRSGGVDNRQQSGNRAPGLVCPGCGRSGVRGGVRCIGGGPEINGEEEQVKQQDSTQAAVPTSRINQAAPCPEEQLVGGTEGSSMGWVRRSGEYSTDTPSSTDFVGAGGTFHTSLGVVVDVCEWGQQRAADVIGAVRWDVDGESNGTGENKREQET